jgi:hypothetical protein
MGSSTLKATSLLRPDVTGWPVQPEDPCPGDRLGEIEAGYESLKNGSTPEQITNFETWD